MQNILCASSRKKSHAVQHLVSGSRFEAETLVTGLIPAFACQSDSAPISKRVREHSLSLKFF